MKESDNCMGRHISIVNKYFKVFLKANLSDIDINPTEFMVVLTLFETEGLSQEGVVEKLGYDKGVLARTIKTLEKSNYIKRIQDEKDRRAYKLYSTEKALEIKPFMIDILKKWNDSITGGIDEDMVNIVIEQMQTMAENAYKAAMNAKNGEKDERK